MARGRAVEEVDPDFDSAGPSSSLLPNNHPQSPVREINMELTRTGRLRAYYLGIVVCMGGFLFGYDSGIIGGVLSLDSYRNDFRYTKGEATHVQGLANGLQQLGAFVACFFIWPVTHKFGRRTAIMACSALFILGVIIQTINTHSIEAFYVARVIAGLGLGGSSVVVPMFSSEMTPKQLRGQIGSFYQLMFTLGIFTSYWVDYGVAKDIDNLATKQWQIPIGLQMLPAAFLGFGMLTLKESVRWLTINGRHEEAWNSLKWIRASDGEATQLEMEEIRNGVALELHEREGFKMLEMVDKHNWKRTVTASAVFLAQQATGATAFAYYGPQYFKLLVNGSTTGNLLLTAIFGAIKFAACLTFVIFVADNVDRRKILTGGALFMAACQISTAAVVATHPAKPDGGVTSSGIATIALIYMFVIAYNFSWGPLPWPYVSEIFPTRTREPGIAIGVSTQWLFNFVFSLTTPYMIKNMGYGTFLLWGIFDLVIALYAWFGLTETRGKSLEQITHLDTAVSGKSIDEAEEFEGGRTKHEDHKVPGVGIQ